MKTKLISIPVLNMSLCLPISTQLGVLCTPSYHLAIHSLSQQFHALTYSHGCCNAARLSGLLCNLTSTRYQLLTREFCNLFSFMTRVVLPFQRSQFCILKLSVSYCSISSIKNASDTKLLWKSISQIPPSTPW